MAKKKKTKPPRTGKLRPRGQPFAKGNGYGGPKPNSGRKPSDVKAIERELMDALYPACDLRGNVLKDSRDQPIILEIGQMCVLRLIAIAHGPDPGAAVRACEALLNRKFGRPTERVETKSLHLHAMAATIDDATRAIQRQRLERTLAGETEGVGGAHGSADE